MIKHETEIEVQSNQLKKQALPPMWRVVLLNDDLTPMDYVVYILKAFFALDIEKARQVMLTVHTQGRGTAGVYSKDIAVTKMMQVIQHARARQYPLQCIVEVNE